MADQLANAALNREATKDLLRSLDLAVDDFGYEEAAERLGISVLELRMRLDGERDITMTELRLIAIAAEVVIDYGVRPARDLVGA